LRRSLVAWAFLLPALVLISLSVLLPALMALVMSFTASGLDVTEPLRFVGLANLQRLLSDPMVRRVMLTTFLYLFGVVPPIVVGSLALAVLVNRGLPGSHLMRSAFLHTGAGLHRGGSHRLPLALRRKRSDQWLAGCVARPSLHPDRFSDVTTARSACGDGGDALERGSGTTW
jgi:hypothetical protein